MSTDELAVMDGGKCILQVQGVRPFFSDKFDILTPNKSIGNQGMTEKGRSLNFVSLEGTHKRIGFVTNIRTVFRQVSGMNR